MPLHQLGERLLSVNLGQSRRSSMSTPLHSATSASASARTPSTSAAPTGWPGIGIPITTPRASAPGKMRRSSSAAASAFFVFPPMQSLWANSDWRTGFEYETLPRRFLGGS